MSAAARAPAGRLDPAESLALHGRLGRAAAMVGDLREPRARWVRAYIACARGDFPSAEAAARSLSRAADPDLRARAALTLGSALRQTGRHAEARLADRRALAAAPRGTPGASLRAHALIGLAADAVGLSDSAGCARMLARASRAAPRGDWRVAVRLAWVRAEHALLAGRPRAAVPHARRALERSRRAGALRHEAKSSLFLGAAMRAAGEPSWRAPLREARALARRAGAAPVEAVARELLAAGEPAPG